MKKVIIVSSSARKNGNSETLAAKFAKGAIDAGNLVDMIILRDLNVEFCRGCLACQTIKKCVIKDDVANLIDKVADADVLVFATPIYYYSVCGRLKNFLDRLNPIYSKGHTFKEVYLIATAADDAESTTDGAKKDISGWVECFDEVKFNETIFAGAVNDLGDINNFPEKLDEAYKAGINV